MHQADIKQKLKSKVGGKMSAELALSIDVFDQVTADYGVPNAIKSVYNMAQMFGLPLDALINSEAARCRCYQTIYSRFHDKNSGVELKSTLKQQVHYVASAYSQMFIDLSLLIGAYASLIHHGLSSFLSNEEAQEKIQQLKAQLSYDDVIKLEQQMLAALKNDIPAQERLTLLNQAINDLSEHIPGFHYLFKLAEEFNDLERVEHHLLNRIDARQAQLTDDMSWNYENIQTMENAAVANSKGGNNMAAASAINQVDDMENSIVGDSIKRDLYGLEKDAIHGINDLPGAVYDGVKTEASSSGLLSMADGLISGLKWLDRERLSKKKSKILKFGSSKNTALQMGAQMAALTITIFMTKGLEPRPAMGWSGPDLSDKKVRHLRDTGKFDLIKQDEYLFTHSEMKIPSKKFMEHIYKQKIMDFPGMLFGAFPVGKGASKA
jgi:hypothetical protein